MRAIIALVVFLVAASAQADYLEVRRNATLKEAANSGAEVRERFEEGDLLELLDLGVQTNGYYHARSPGGQAGYIYRTLVRRHTGAIPGATPADTGTPDAGSSSDQITVTRPQQASDIPSGAPPSGVYRIHLIDVGTGLAVLIQGHDFTMLYDGGSGDDGRGISASSGNNSRLLAYLYAAIGPSGAAQCAPNGDNFVAPDNGTQLVIDHVFLSHPHLDHGAMLDEVLTCYQVTNIWDSGAVNNRVFYENFLQAVAAETGSTYHTETSPPTNRSITLDSDTSVVIPNGVTWTSFAEGDHQHLGDQAWFDVLFADGDHHSDPNQNSTVIRVQLSDTSLLLTGDAESGARLDPSEAVGHTEADLLDDHRNAIDVDILQVGHHGSMTSSRSAFLEAVSPTWALIGAGSRSYSGVVLPDAVVVTALLDVLGTGGDQRLLSTDVNDRAREAESGTPHVCPVVNKVGTDSTSQPGGCDNFILEVDAR